MVINETVKNEQSWAEELEQALRGGDEYFIMPSSAMSKESAVNLAIRLSISVMANCDDYAFTTTTEATQALLNRGKLG